jgi:DNA repair exonuclease SbcCD ATPase subunit
MIIFEKLRWRNLLSTGDAFTEVLLNTHGTTLIVGENGAGKSTILDALSFALFGKPFRKVNKNQLVNSINKKGTLVEVEFVVGKHRYMIRRGIKPNVFEVYQNDNLVNLDASVGDYQEMLDKQILKINHKSFSQIVVLGSASFVPFMQLPAASRREVIEDLLDIQIFSVMNTLLKDKVSSNKSELTENTHQRDMTDTKIEMEQKHINAVHQDKQLQIDEKTTKFNELKKRVKSLQKKAEALQKRIDEFGDLEASHNKALSKIQSLNKLASEAKTKIDMHRKHIDFVCDNESCPTCTQPIDDSFRTSVMGDRLVDITKLEEIQEALNEKLGMAQEDLDNNKALGSQVKSHQSELDQINVDIRLDVIMAKSIKHDIDGLSVQTAQNDDNAETIAQLNADKDRIDKTRQNLIEQRSVLDAASVMLKDTGIKTKIIKQYIPVINKLINKYLAAMDFFVNFELDENFDEKIRSRFRDDFSYASFSEGEKSRLDLALLFTWRSISKLRNSTSTNLLILDEVFDGSLDTQGNEELLKIIAELTEGSNVFVISHKTDVYLDKFSRVLRFEKVKNFSRMKEL